MSFDRVAEAIIKEAMERGEFDDLPGKGMPIDLTEYFEAPKDVRVANSVLKNAGVTSRGMDLLKEIAELKQGLTAVVDEKKKQGIQQQIQQRQVDFSLMLEQQNVSGRGSKINGARHRLSKDGKNIHL